MLSFASIRPRVSEWRGWLPLAALPPLMFAVLLALGGDRGYFYRDGGFHNWNTAKTLAIAENLSPEYNFRLMYRVWRDADGGLAYSPYSRFPIGGFALVKIATMPFGNDVAATLLAARVLMLLMFCGAAALACLAIYRLTGSRWIALAAALTAFSGLYAVYYADEVSSESVMDLFGAALVFHGMVVFIQDGRFRQLLVKTCAALLLGWHVYALLLPFIALGFGGEAVALSRSALASGEKAKAWRLTVIALVRSRYAALAAVAILFGSALLAFNLANEYTAYGGEQALTETPTFRSMLKRFGVNSWATEWDTLLERQFYRVGAVSTPYAAARAVGYDFPAPEPNAPPFAPTILGAAATVAALVGLALARRYRILTATAILFGFCWAIPLRHNTYNPNYLYEGLPYMGLALALFALALVGARRRLGARIGERVCIGLSAAAACVFALSVFYAGQWERHAGKAELNKAAMADFSAIREVAAGKRVTVAPDVQTWNEYVLPGFGMYYYLAGSFIRLADGADAQNAAAADYVVSRYRVESMNPLTPDNRLAFLYDSTDPAQLYRAERRRLELATPAASADFDVYVYMEDGSLRYLKSPCAPSDVEPPFFLHVYPANPDDPLEFEGINFGFENKIEILDGACMGIADLPGYPTSAIRTGQYISGGKTVWEVAINPPLDGAAVVLYEEKYRAIASGEPAARSAFDLYLEDDTLYYLKEPCNADDVRGRFFLSVHPADVQDLPNDRSVINHHASLNFTFAPPIGVIFGGKCMASRRLPDYPIARIETGQWIPGGERLWRAEIVVGD